MPDFQNFLKILKREHTDKPALFELYLNNRLYEKLAGRPVPDADKMVSLEKLKLLVDAYKNAGYDYATAYACNYVFENNNHSHGATVSLNEGAVITDRESFNAYPWKEMSDYSFSHLEEISEYLPENMKLNIMGPGGVLENVVSLVGFENLCFMLMDEDPLVEDVFNAVGQRLLDYYVIAAKYDSVGVLTANDDWGFKTQTFFSADILRKFVFPWHKKIVEVIHSHNKPALLHSCGNLATIMDDIIDYMGYDAKHSYEDTIIKVEDAYDKWGERICILGGMDVNFLIEQPEDVISERCRNIMKKTSKKGGYMLGSGNSIPDYVPDDKYFAMINSLRTCIQ